MLLLDVREPDIHRELAETGRCTAQERITALVKAERCACEVKNPQGSCSLGNVAGAVASLAVGPRPPTRVQVDRS